MCDEDFTNIRACEGHRCTLIFADHTRRRGRRWCSMAMCGNRAKQAAHRHRLKAERLTAPPHARGGVVENRKFNPSEKVGWVKSASRSVV